MGNFKLIHSFGLVNVSFNEKDVGISRRLSDVFHELLVLGEVQVVVIVNIRDSEV